MQIQNPDFDIAGRRILVTGASSGFGQFFATRLAARGARVVLAARRLDRCQDTVQQIQAAGGTATAVAMDVSDSESVRQAFSAAGPVDVLVNNAGINILGATDKLSDQDWQQVLDTNLNGVWRCSRQAIQIWKTDDRPGNIINIASILGLRVAGQLGPYAASKAAVVQLTRSLALDFARNGIRCNAICPGYFETDINRDFMQTDAGQKQIKRIPQRRMGDLSELLGPILLLASDASTYMTGSILTVDGGHLVNTL